MDLSPEWSYSSNTAVHRAFKGGPGDMTTGGCGWIAVAARIFGCGLRARREWAFTLNYSPAAGFSNAPSRPASRSWSEAHSESKRITTRRARPWTLERLLHITVASADGAGLTA